METPPPSAMIPSVGEYPFVDRSGTVPTLPHSEAAYLCISRTQHGVGVWVFFLSFFVHFLSRKWQTARMCWMVFFRFLGPHGCFDVHY